MATRTALSPSWDDVNHAVNGGGPFVGPAPHGTIINIPGGPATWPQPIQTTQKLQIIGLNPANPPVITGGAGGPIFKLTPVLNDARLRLSNMVWVRNNPANFIFSLIGVCPINNDLTGGFQIDKIYMKSDNVLNAGGRKANEAGKNWDLGGWLEGVIFDCIWDFDVTKGTKGTGEHVIMNQNRSPSTVVNCGYGDWSWSHAYDLGTIHQVIFEDCIIKRRGGLDCNQGGGGAAGGARYTGRHCTSWGSIGSGHEARSDGASRATGGLRASESYKNLFIRDGTDTTPNVQTANFTNVRSGENVTWGNRYNRFGAPHDGASTPLSLDAYNYSAWNADSAYGGPDGANPWDLNETGVITPNSSSFTPTSTDPFGSIYASGTGGSRAANTAPGNKTITLTGMSSMVTDRWKGFVIRNLDAVNGRYSASPVSFGFIVGNGLNTFTVAASSEPNDQIDPVNKQFNIAGGQRWEIRRVKQYFNTVGAGTMDAMPDFAFPGAFEATNHVRLVGTGDRRWTNNETPGVSQWDNKYRTSDAPTPFSDVAIWQGTTKYQHAIINARNTASHPGYSYSSGTSGGPDNLVGAASSVWDFLIDVIGDPNNIAAIPGVDSISQAGSGGFDYPHPFRASAATPNITSQDHVSFTQGVGGTFQATSSGFSAGPTYARSGGTFPASGTTLNSAGLLTVGVGSAAGTYNFDLVATNGGQSDTQPFTLTITASPTKVILLTGSLAFGDHDALTTSTLPLTIKNNGNTVLTVTSISLPSGFTADWTSGTIAPAASQTVTVTFSPLAANSYSGTVTVSSDKTSGTNTIAASGVGVTRVIGMSGDLAFGDVTVGQTSTRQMTIANTGNRALTVSAMSYPPDFSGSFLGTVAAGGTHLVDVTFSPTIEQAYTGVVNVTSDKTSGTNTLAVSGTGVVTATKIIQLTGDLNFGEVQTGTTVNKTLTITNGGDTNLAVASISYPSGFTGSYAGTIAPGASHDVTVTFSPVAATSYSGTVTVTSDATGGTNTTTASGDGVVPSTKIIGLTTGTGASSFTFGNVQVGGTATRTLVIANTGSATLTVTSITLPTGYSGSFAGTIASGATHNVTITFSPVSNIVYSGNITVVSDKTSGTNTIATTGTGVQAGTKVIGLTGDLNFGNVQKLHTVVRPFTIMNSGSLSLAVSAITCPTGFTADISSVTLVPGASQVVNVTFAPLLQQTYGGDITVTSDKTAGVNTIPCSGNGKNKKQVPMFVIVN